MTSRGTASHSVPAGKLRERVQIQRLTATPDGAGGFLHAWVPLLTRAAAVLPNEGHEALLDEAMRSVQSYRVTIRFGSGIKPEDRLLWNGLLLNVRSAVDPDGRRVWTLIDAVAGVVTQ